MPDPSKPCFTANPDSKNTLGKRLMIFAWRERHRGKTNHSMYATGVLTFPSWCIHQRKLIQQTSGHASIDGMQQYQRTSFGQEEAMSKVLISAQLTTRIFLSGRQKFHHSSLLLSRWIFGAVIYDTIYNGPFHLDTCLNLSLPTPLSLTQSVKSLFPTYEHYYCLTVNAAVFFPFSI